MPILRGVLAGESRLQDEAVGVVQLLDRLVRLLMAHNVLLQPRCRAHVLHAGRRLPPNVPLVQVEEQSAGVRLAHEHLSERLLSHAIECAARLDDHHPTVILRQSHICNQQHC